MAPCTPSALRPGTSSKHKRGRICSVENVAPTKNNTGGVSGRSRKPNPTLFQFAFFILVLSASEGGNVLLHFCIRRIGQVQSIRRKRKRRSNWRDPHWYIEHAKATPLGQAIHDKGLQCKQGGFGAFPLRNEPERLTGANAVTPSLHRFNQHGDLHRSFLRSEERRVGKECRSRW